MTITIENPTKLNETNFISNVPSLPNEKELQTKELKSSAVSEKNVEKMVIAFNELTNILKTKLNFSFHKPTNNIIIKVINSDTDQVIKQIPLEDLVKIQEKMQDLTGLLFDNNA